VSSFQQTPRWAGQIASSGDKVAILIEDLDPALLAVGNKDYALRATDEMSWVGRTRRRS